MDFHFFILVVLLILLMTISLVTYFIKEKRHGGK
jgi:hypothetical protein